MKSLKLVLASGLAAPLFTLANGIDGDFGWGMMRWGMMGGYGGFFGGFFMLAYSTIFLVLGVLAIIWLWQHIDKK